MKRLFALLLILNLLVLGLSAANGASSYSLEGGTRNREVVFRADAFVRLGFASIPVMTTVSMYEGCFIVYAEKEEELTNYISRIYFKKELDKNWYYIKS